MIAKTNKDVKKCEHCREREALHFTKWCRQCVDRALHPGDFVRRKTIPVQKMWYEIG